eukprot:scaffold2503_cov301-Prasinococcus_capsulatus_cf.AAC.3
MATSCARSHWYKRRKGRSQLTTQASATSCQLAATGGNELWLAVRLARTSAHQRCAAAAPQGAAAQLRCGAAPYANTRARNQRQPRCSRRSSDDKDDDDEIVRGAFCRTNEQSHVANVRQDALVAVQLRAALHHRAIEATLGQATHLPRHTPSQRINLQRARACIRS